MFLTKRSLMTVMFVNLVGIFAQAAVPAGLEIGSYRLTSGPADFCQNFNISSADLTSPKVAVAGRYTMIMKNSTSKTESEFDANCEFRQNTTRENEPNETRVSRLNAEYCGSTLKSETLTQVFFRGSQIRVEVSIKDRQNATGYSCEFVKN